MSGEKAMSEEAVELYRRGIDAFNRRDLDAFLALADPGVIGVSRVLAIEGGSYEGHQGVRDWWEELLGVFPDFMIEILWVRAAGNVTVSALRNRAHGEGSAAPLQELVWQVSEWRDGRVVRWQMYETEQDALEAAGLSE
jgi:ketosteroid isomerase-like protein